MCLELDTVEDIVLRRIEFNQNRASAVAVVLCLGISDPKVKPWYKETIDSVILRFRHWYSRTRNFLGYRTAIFVPGVITGQALPYGGERRSTKRSFSLAAEFLRSILIIRSLTTCIPFW